MMLGSTSEGRDQVDPAEALLREVGAQLKEVRLDRGEDLDDVAQSLRIRSSYLFGIEQGDLSGLPGRTYALGFLRSYANHLGFDGDDLVNRIKSSVGQLTDRTRLRIRAPMPENRLPRTPMVVISLAAVAGIYLGWSYVNRTSRTTPDMVAEAPADVRVLAGIEAPADAGGGTAATGEQRSTTAALQDRASDETEAVPPPGIAAADASSPARKAQASRSSAEPGVDPVARGAMLEARPVEPAPAAADQLAGVRGDAPEPVIAPGARQAGAPPADPLTRGESEALSVQPAAGAERGDPRPQTPPPGSTTGAREETAAATPAESEGAADDADPARRAVALLLDAAASGAGGAGEVYERANTDARVILRARDRAWIEVSSPRGDYRFTRTLEPGDALLVPNRSDLVLWTGNAGGLEIIVDGVPVAPLAGGGAVRRNVSLDPDRLSGATDRLR
jgi:cytoskeleton protein RodZ